MAHANLLQFQRINPWRAAEMAHFSSLSGLGLSQENVSGRTASNLRVSGVFDVNWDQLVDNLGSSTLFGDVKFLAVVFAF